MKGDPKHRLQLRIERTLINDAKKMARRKKVTLTAIVEDLLRTAVAAHHMELYAKRAARKVPQEAEQI